jgi:RNA polymerase sigma factor (sigma-70 family)
MMDDVELLERWRAGDAEAGNELFSRHFHAVLRVFRYKVQHADDLVQRTFLACIEHREAISDGRKLRAYLLRIAKNQLYAHLRSRAGRGDLDTGVTSLQELGGSPSAVVGEQREHARLLAALQQIPLDYQIALELFYWEDMKGDELAEVLGIPVGTVRSRLRLGKQMLRAVLAEPGRVLGISGGSGAASTAMISARHL